MKLLTKNKPRNLWINQRNRLMVKSSIFLLTSLFFNPTMSAYSNEKFVIKEKISKSLIQQHIEGKVIGENGTPIVGANIVVKGTAITTQTGFDGKFEINIPDNANTVIVTFIGMEKREVTISKTFMTITLKEINQNLNEVIVVGYGTVKKSKLTGSVAKLDHKVLETGMRANPASALAGTVSGLRVIQSSGSPGSEPTIILRGGTEYNGTGSPLVMVDGFLRSGFSDINQEDIASIEVLKDASATAIYGARANNGVILITTKKGKAGVSSISISTKLGVNTLNTPYDFLNAQDYLFWSRKAVENSGKYDPSRLGQLATAGPFGTGNLYKDGSGNILDGNKNPGAVWSPMFKNSTNQELLGQGWQTMIDPIKTNSLGAYDINGTNKEIIFKDFNYEDYALRSQSLTKDLNISMSGGSDRGNYYAGIGSYEEEGLPINTFYKRLTFVFNGEYKVKPWLTSISSVNFADAKWRNATKPGRKVDVTEAEYLTRALGAAPTMRGINANGELLLGRDAFDGNPQVNDDKFIRKNNTDKFTLSQSFKIDILKNLSIKTSANWFYNLGFYENFDKDYLLSSGVTTKTRYSSASYDKTFSQTYNAALNYNTSYGKNHMDAMVGTEYYNRYDNSLSANGTGAPSDDFRDLIYTSSDKEKRNIDTFHRESAIMSFFTRINYDYNEKYLLTLTARRDGYSTLLNNRWGNFPGASLGWNIHKENFFSNLTSVVNSFKLRASYGQNGNVSTIGAYAIQGIYGPGIDLPKKFDGNVGFQEEGLPFPDLKWEKSATYEIGFDSRILNKLDFSFGYYNRQTQDKISRFALPATSGLTSITTNLGSMQNKGIEMELNYKAIQTSDFSLNLSANMAYNTNKVLKLPNSGLENNRVGSSTGIPDASQVYDSTGNLVWVNGLQEGQDPNVAYAYVAEGIIRNQSDLDSYALKLKDLIGNKPLVHPDVFNAMTPADKAKHYPIALGDVMWKDVNKDGIINSYDREYMGRTVPTTTGGFGIYAKWKGVSLSTRFDYALGFVQYDGPKSWFLSNAQGSFNTTQDVKDTWTPENPNAKYPTYYWADQLFKNNTMRTSSMFYKKGDYLAFREISLAYSLPSDLLKKISVENIKFTLTAQNICYWSESTLFSPETTTNGTSVNGGYPLPRTVILGAQFNL